MARKSATDTATVPATRAATRPSSWAADPWAGLMSRFGLPDAWPTAFSSEMKVEEQRDDDHLIVRVEIPGVDPEKDIEVTILDGTLCIHAERRREAKEEDEHRVRSEFRYGSFTRRVPLPRGATDDDVKASYRDGILEVSVPVAGKGPASTRIPIGRG